MGREVRRVPATWQHPRDTQGNYLPLFDGFIDRYKTWVKEYTQWERGYTITIDGTMVPRTVEMLALTYTEWSGPCPDAADYMPDWPDDERTHWQMYETTSEGTPLSPLCDTPEQLAQWLVDHHTSFFGDMTTNYAHWLGIIHGTELDLPIFQMRTHYSAGRKS